MTSLKTNRTYQISNQSCILNTFSVDKDGKITLNFPVNDSRDASYNMETRNIEQNGSPLYSVQNIREIFQLKSYVRYYGKLSIGNKVENVSFTVETNREPSLITVHYCSGDHKYFIYNMIIREAIPHSRVDGTNPYTEYEYGQVIGSIEDVYETIKLEYNRQYNASLTDDNIISFYRVKKQYSYPMLIDIVVNDDNQPIKGYHFIIQTNSSIQLIPAKAQTFYDRGINDREFPNSEYFEDLNSEPRNIKVILPEPESCIMRVV